MPLVRYEVRCEHSLANPELYRATEQDDSEGLLEGVAMAGLVGLVRQLGDLAEFAAEIFHELHDDIIKIVARGQSVKTRVTRLEADLPQVEKALLAKANQFKFAYTARSKWRAPLPMDQSVCGQGELPRFVQSFYDDCRGPPRLFLLDKFDGGGRGACVKRYTDPTFFRLTWATSQLERAEQIERERQEHFEQEQLETQKIQKQSSMKKGSKIAGSVYPRERLSSAHFENLEGFTGDFTPELRSMRLDPLPEGGDLTPDEPQSPVQKPKQQQQQLPEVDQGPVLAPLKISAKDIENAKKGRSRMQTPTSEDDGASDYVDAMTTMGSDADSELSRWSARNSARLSADSAQSPMPVEWEHFDPQPDSRTVDSKEQSVEEQQAAVTTPRSRRQWEKDNASSIILSMADIESLSLRERLVESTEASSSRALVEEKDTELRIRGYASSPSSPYTVVSSSSVMDEDDDDGFTSESARSSPNAGPSFCTLMSPPESPPPKHGLMGSPVSSPRAPPVIPLLSASPLMSRSSSVKYDPSVPPPDASSAEKIKVNLVTDPSESGGPKLDSSGSPDQTSAVPNPVTRPRTWVDRSEINVAATLRAIRQAAAVGSDDDTASECRSEAGS